MLVQGKPVASGANAHVCFGILNAKRFTPCDIKKRSERAPFLWILQIEGIPNQFDLFALLTEENGHDIEPCLHISESLLL